jgi:hypothetical protein
MYYYGKTLINNCITWIISLINMNWIELKFEIWHDVKLMFDDLSKKREQNLVVFASNWRSGNLAIVFIE